MSTLPQILHIDLRRLTADYADLRYSEGNLNAFEARRLPLADIQDLIEQMERDYYVALPEEYVKTGRRLYEWLDGSDRWLSTLLGSGAAVLAIATEQRLAHLPWEVLHDKHGFLVGRSQPVVPVRWQGERLTWQTTAVPNRPLQMLFMATSPVGVEPVLDFEAEEGRILEATQRQPLTLTVEESGCLDELADLLTSYDRGHFDVVHLSGHAWIGPEGETEGETEGPRFITETETGDRFDASPQDIAKALQFRFPALMFLSGCRTGQSGGQGEVPSMAAALLDAGAGAVLGWGRPVRDVDGILAAEALYAALAGASTLPEALAKTYQVMIKQKARDWHLLRLYVAGAMPQNLVTPLKTKGRQKAMKSSMAMDFLDVEQRVKVPKRESFVGRRRPLQACLRALRDPERTGVLIHGMGGLGKSSLAARLCDRLTDFTRLVWVGALDEAALVNKLAQKLRDPAVQHRLRDPDRELKYRLLDAFEAQSDREFLLVLDDFEANLEPVNDGFRLKADGKENPAAVLKALMWTIEEAQSESGREHRVVMTCRYDFEFSGLARPYPRIYKQPLAGLAGADLRKKRQQLVAFGDKSEIEKPLRERALRLADGNPRLMEWLDKVLRNPAELGAGSVTAVLDKLEREPKELRERVLAEALVQQMDEPMREMLARAAVYDLPVPEGAIGEICEEGAAVEGLIGRAVALGLLEQSVDGGLRVPRVLGFDSAQTTELMGRAAQVLYGVWWEGAESSSEAQRLEIHRLAVGGRETDITKGIAKALSTQWLYGSRFREAIDLLEKSLAIEQSGELLYRTAYAYEALGNVSRAVELFRLAVNSFPESIESDEEHGEKAATLHCLAMLKANQGDVEGAIALYQDSLAIKEQIGNVQGKAATLHQLAILKANQGDVEGAIALYQDSLAITEQICDVKTKAATLHQLAILKADQGDVEGAIALYRDSLAIHEQIGNVQGKATTLHCLANLKADQGDVDGAIALYQDSLAIKEQIGDVKGKAATLHCLASLKADQGDVDGAIALFRQSLAIKEKIGNVQGKAMTLWWLGELAATKQNDPATAIGYLQESLAILQQIHSPDAQAVQDLLNRITNE